MVQLKNKIKIINSMPSDKEKKKSSIIPLIILIIILIGTSITFYQFGLPYIKAIKIDKVMGKKVCITECNTKDYIIINKDKSYSMNLTDKNCETNYFEGNLTIKNNEIFFNKNIVGIIDDNYNIIINNNLFKSDKNE